MPRLGFCSMSGSTTVAGSVPRRPWPGWRGAAHPAGHADRLWLVGVALCAGPSRGGLTSGTTTAHRDARPGLRESGQHTDRGRADEDDHSRRRRVVDIARGAGEHGGHVVVSAGLGAEEDQGVADRRGSVRPAQQFPFHRAGDTRHSGPRAGGAGCRRAQSARHLRRGVPHSAASSPSAGFPAPAKVDAVNDILYAVLANSINKSKLVPGRHRPGKGLPRGVDKVAASTSRPSAGPPGPTGDVHRRGSTTCGSCSPARPRRSYGVISRVASRSRQGVGAARRAPATAPDQGIESFPADVYVPCGVVQGRAYNAANA